MISFPNAKINLGLNIVSKREDNYHNIESCFYPIPWHDSLEIIEAPVFSFHVHGLEIPGDDDSNLCVKAYQLLKRSYGLPPISIHLLKQIPMGAGLGGGSSDGAFMLKMLNSHFSLNISRAELERFAMQLGSDCAFFIQNTPALATGRGEELKTLSIDLGGYWLAAHNPDIHIATREAYDGVTPKKPHKSIYELITRPIAEWKNHLKNDFESSLFPKYPILEETKEKMYEAGAIFSSMTGSGSTIFGIFDEKTQNNWHWIKL